MEKKRVAHNKLTQEDIIKAFHYKHGDDFDYSDVVYVDVHTPVKIRCKKHDCIFYPTPKNHKNGGKCYYCGREAQIEKAKKDVNKFKQEVKELYGDRYNCDLVDYKNNKTPVILICNEHGEFKKRPDAILQGVACKKCSNRTKSNDKEIFIQEAKKIYGEKDDYTDTEIISSKHKIEIRCIKHDLIFIKDIETYLGGWGCPQCSADNYSRIRSIPKDEYYRRANEKHDNKYTYLDDYISSNEDMTFLCPEHGKIKRNAYNHLKGYGCPYCEKSPHKTSRMTKEGYCRIANSRPTFLYLIECNSEDEKFYKIGKTFQEINKRFTKSKIPYNVELIYKYECTAENIWDLEIEMHEKYKKYSYKPKKYFRGYTECYNLSLPIDEIWKTS